MKNLFGVALKAFTFFFVIFVLPRLVERMFFPTYIHGRIWPPLHHILIQGSAGAAITTLALVCVHVWFVRKISNSADTDYGVHQRLETDVAQPVSTLFQYLKNRLENKDWKIVHLNENTGLLRFEIYSSSRVWNDFMTIHLYPKGMNETTLIAESKPGGWPKLADNGKNLHNIQLLKELLRQYTSST